MMKVNLARCRAINCKCRWGVCRCPVDYIVFYAQGNSGQWVVERTSAKAEMARGSLEEMMLLVGPEGAFPGRRAHWAEDMGRFRPSVFFSSDPVYDPFHGCLSGIEARVEEDEACPTIRSPIEEAPTSEG